MFFSASLCLCGKHLRALLLASLVVALAFGADFETGAVVRSGGEFYRNMVPQVARLGNGDLLAVWPALAKDAHAAKVYGAFSQDGGRTWGAPQLLLSDPAKSMLDPNLLVDGNRVWVFSTQVNVPNRSDKDWTIGVRSDDNGATWSKPYEVAIPRQYVTGKQANAIVLRDGSYVMGVAWDKWPEIGMAARSEGEMDLTAGVLISRDGQHWTLHGAVHAKGEKLTPFGTSGLCEPSLVELESGEILMILRSGTSHHYEARSTDGGLTWSKPVPSPLPGHNTPTALLRLHENPREIVAMWNNSPLTRNPLSVALSADGGKSWSVPRIVVKTDGFEVSYPGLTQTPDGTIVAVWQESLPGGGREIRWARFSRAWVLGGK